MLAAQIEYPMPVELLRYARNQPKPQTWYIKLGSGGA
jgi:hypothetical protein